MVKKFGNNFLEKEENKSILRLLLPNWGHFTLLTLNLYRHIIEFKKNQIYPPKNKKIFKQLNFSHLSQ